MENLVNDLDLINVLELPLVWCLTEGRQDFVVANLHQNILVLLVLVIDCFEQIDPSADLVSLGHYFWHLLVDSFG